MLTDRLRQDAVSWGAPTAGSVEPAVQPLLAASVPAGIRLRPIIACAATVGIVALGYWAWNGASQQLSVSLDQPETSTICDGAASEEFNALRRGYHRFVQTKKQVVADRLSALSIDMKKQLVFDPLSVIDLEMLSPRFSVPSISLPDVRQLTVVPIESASRTYGQALGLLECSLRAEQECFLADVQAEIRRVFPHSFGQDVQENNSP